LSMIIWAQKGDPPAETAETVFWQSYGGAGPGNSIPRYLEDHAEGLRAKYLEFIHDLGERNIAGKRVIDHFDTGDGFSLWSMSELAEKSPLKSPQIYDCLRLLALEELLVAHKPRRITLQSNNVQLAQALKRLCESLQIILTWQREKKSRRDFSLIGIYRTLPHSLQALVALSRHLILRWPLRQLDRPRWFSDPDAMFICSYFTHLDSGCCARGHYYSRQWEVLTDYLQASGRRTNWVHHFLFSAAMPNVGTGLRWLKLFNRRPSQEGNHAFLDSFLNGRIVLRAVRKWLRLRGLRASQGQIAAAFYPRNSAVWLWPFLKSTWISSQRGSTAIINCLWIELFDAALEEIPRQKSGLYLWENQGWERALIRAWRRHGHGRIIGVQHATVPFWHLNNFSHLAEPGPSHADSALLPDYLAVNGPGALEALANGGFPRGKLVATEALRYLKLEKKDSPPAVSASSGGDAQRSPSAQVRVLLLGDLVAATTDEFLRMVEAAIKRLPAGYKFTLKPHPACVFCLVDYPGLTIDETTEALDQILNQYDVALAANSTSAAVDAYIAGLPVIVAVGGGELNLSPLRGEVGVRFVSDEKELAKALGVFSAGGLAISPTRKMFFMDCELPRWKHLLSDADPGSQESNYSRFETLP
jgi:surface carbohydrate biosynthesis protein (TIGR04326 family)